MIRIEKALTQPVPTDIYTIGAPEDVLFFDIETTGLSARSAGLYLIGMLTYTDKKWTLLQYFCEDVADEPAVLQAFFELLRTKKTLISYNGDGFDIPFLRHMLEQYGLPYSFDAVESFDLFKKFRPLKRLLNLPDLKLKSCERFLGIDREDRFTGGELIEVYFEWQKTKAPALLDTLLLHNAEDIANLPNLLPLLRYRALPHSDFQLRAHERDECTIHLHYLSAHALPRPMDLRGDFWALHAEGSAVELYVQLFEGERKLFFADFEHYYYLPAEDQVIHQSLAEFVDRSARKKACARNCYQRVSGCFLPECSEVYTPALQAEYRDKLRYAQYSDALFDDEVKAAAYLKSFLEAAL
ncbi:MAG: ribonuclease H-like domain-containing protein [Lachnospiraceae bacterium]|nr:ribonuclease H-like domain-containing protein [Lachnospiraceae bacterium]